MVNIIIANTDADYKAAQMLFQEYAHWLGIDLGFQNFDEELLQLKEMYAAPSGGILLCISNKNYIGCVAIRNKGKDIAELKRMYIQPAFQKAGIGSLLLEKALNLARDLGYKTIRLDTLANMTPAINLYRKAGFYEIEPYYFNPEKNAVFFERGLREQKERGDKG